MNKKYVFCLFIIIFAGGRYVGFECLTNDNNNGGSHIDSTTVSTDYEIVEGISVCSLNIQFLGHFKKKDNVALAELLKNFDIVVIQELVSPRYDDTYPDSEDYTSDIEARGFFDAMIARGFEYVLSEEDTSPGKDIHKKTSATELWVVFYKEEKIDSKTPTIRECHMHFHLGQTYRLWINISSFSIWGIS